MTTNTYQLIGESTINITSQLFFSVAALDAGSTATADFSNTAIVVLTLTTLGGEPIPARITAMGSRGASVLSVAGFAPASGKLN